MFNAILTVPEIHTMQKFDFLDPIIRYQIV